MTDTYQVQQVVISILCTRDNNLVTKTNIFFHSGCSDGEEGWREGERGGDRRREDMGPERERKEGRREREIGESEQAEEEREDLIHSPL